MKALRITADYASMVLAKIYSNESAINEIKQLLANGADNFINSTIPSINSNFNKYIIKKEIEGFTYLEFSKIDIIPKLLDAGVVVTSDYTTSNAHTYTQYYPRYKGVYNIHIIVSKPVIEYNISKSSKSEKAVLYGDMYNQAVYHEIGHALLNYAYGNDTKIAPSAEINKIHNKHWFQELGADIFAAYKTQLDFNNLLNIVGIMYRDEGVINPSAYKKVRAKELYKASVALDNYLKHYSECFKYNLLDKDNICYY